MKTERRHELQHNLLADALENGMEAVKPYTQLILGVVLAIGVVFGVYYYYSARSESTLAESWNTYLAAASSENIEELRKVTENYTGTPAAVWANLSLGDRALQQGLDELFTNKADAKDELNKAETFYLAARQAAHEPLMEQRATLGLARVYESLVKLDKAKEEYQRLKDKWPNGLYASVAAQRLEDLNQLATKEFYDWFAEYEPKSPAAGGLGTPGIKPPFEVPEDPDFGSLKQTPDSSSSQDTSPAKPGETDIKLTPPLLGNQKDKPSQGEPEKDDAPKKSQPDDAASKPAASEKPSNPETPPSDKSPNP